MKAQQKKTEFTIYRNRMREYISEEVFDWRHKFFEKLAGYLSRRGISTDIQERTNISITVNGAKQEIPVRDSIAFLYDNNSGDYYIIDCHDWIKPDDTKLIVRDRSCRRVLKCQYNKSYFKKSVYNKIVPWTYFDRFWPENDDTLTSTRAIEPEYEKIYFRGVAWGHRGAILDELIKRGLMNPDYDPVDFEEYHRECSQYRIMLSLPGLAEVCHRDIEGFASGRCILRPKIENEFHDNLIPDHHYISVDIDLETEPAVAADRIEKRFNEVIGDREFLDFIASNAMKWYDENVSLKSVLRLTADLLGLKN